MNNIIKRIHINPQSKGSLGKSFEAEFRTTWLDYHGIRWSGCVWTRRASTRAETSQHMRGMQAAKFGHNIGSATKNLVTRQERRHAQFYVS